MFWNGTEMIENWYIKWMIWTAVVIIRDLMLYHLRTWIKICEQRRQPFLIIAGLQLESAAQFIANGGG